jgi:hypothetical protein
MSCLGPEHEYNALTFTAAWALGYRAYTIPTLNLPTLILAGAPFTTTTTTTTVFSPPSVYSTLKEIGRCSDEILSMMPETDVKKVAADTHVIPKSCKGLDVLYTPHKSSPCPCRAVEVIAEISSEGIARPLAINPVKAVQAENNPAPGEHKKINVAERLGGVLSLVKERAGHKVPLEVDAEYTRSDEALGLLISSGWKFTTRIRSDSRLGREVKEKMLSEGLQVYGKWYDDGEEYGGRYQIVGRRLPPPPPHPPRFGRRAKKKEKEKEKEKEPTILLYLSTKRLSPERVIEERRHRWRLENLFKNVDIDCTPGNDDDELRGYYTLGFFMAEMGRAFGASTKTVGLIMNREGRVTVEEGVMKVRLEGLDRRLLGKIQSYVEHVNRLRRGSVKLRYQLLAG